ncbi:MAG: Gfo/Idh/MocA family oxidoreductase [Caldivirga sp.]
MDKVRVGVIGVGGHGRGRHLIPYTKLPNVEVVAVADVNQRRAEEVGREFKVRYYTDYMEMIERENPDAVSIVTPTGLHAKVAKDVLSKGVHVLVDKPLGANLSEVVDVVRTAKAKGKVLMVGYWSRFSPALKFGVEAMSLGMVGEPYLAYGYLVRRRGIPGSPTFIDKQLSGGRGALLDIGCYILDNLLSLLNFPRPVTVSGATYTKFGRNPEEVKFNWGSWDPSKFELEDYAVGFIRFENGASMIIEVGWAANVSHVGEVGIYRVLGDKGGLEGRGHEAVTEMTLHSRTSNFLYDTKPVLGNVDMPLEMVKAFIDSITQGKEPPTTGYQSVIIHSIIDAIYESASKGSEVRVTIPEI